MAKNRNATLYRMVLPEHTCPFGVRATQLLGQHGYDIDDRVLHSRAEVDAFEAEHDAQTTRQVFMAASGSEEATTLNVSSSKPDLTE